MTIYTSDLNPDGTRTLRELTPRDTQYRTAEITGILMLFGCHHGSEAFEQAVTQARAWITREQDWERHEHDEIEPEREWARG